MSTKEKIAWNKSRPYKHTLWKGIQKSIGTADDGVVGPNTITALEDYQKNNGLPIDGKCGRLTLTHILLRHLHEPQGVMWDGKMEIDADGSRYTYNSLNTGYDSIHNAGAPGKYFGLATDKQGNPFVWQQTSHGNQWYVSQTALVDPSKPIWDPNRYVDPENTEYVVLPRNMDSMCSEDIKLGDVGLVFELGKHDYRVPIICADVGPNKTLTKSFGEASILCAEMFSIPIWDHRELEIGNENIQYKRAARGSNREFIYLLFPGSGNRKMLSSQEILEKVEQAFEDWGGEDRLNLLFDTVSE